MDPLFQKVDAGQVLDGPDILETATIVKSCLEVKHWCQDLEQIERKRQAKEILDEDTNKVCTKIRSCYSRWKGIT